MFKIGSFEEELFATMQKSLVSSQLDNKLSLEKLSKAADYINTAAELLDDTGFRVEADILTRVLTRLAGHDTVSDIDTNRADHLRTPEDIENLLTSKTYPDEIIMDPLEEEIAPETVREERLFDHLPENVPESLNFESIAAKMAIKMAANKINKKKR